MRPASCALLLAVFAACHPSGPTGPLHLMALTGQKIRSASVATSGETRPALLQSFQVTVPLPARPLLTFGMGLAYAGEDEAPGWYRLKVRAGDTVLAERTLNPRAARGWHDFSIPLAGLGRGATLAFDVRLTDREGRDIPAPPALLLAVSDPIVHDLDAYGRSKGIVLVSIDTLRRDHVGAYGYGPPTTPRLDALAREAVVAEDTVSTSSWTLPAHLSLLTSVAPSAHGGVDLNHGFNHRVPTVTAALHQAGFATEAVTSHLYVSSVYGVDDGFDHLDFHQDRKAAEVANRAIDILDRVGDRPFFLFLHFYDPHWHYDPPAETLRLFESGYAGTLTGFWQDFSKHDRSNTSAEDLRHLVALYDGEIRYTDGELGRVLDHLRTRGLDRGTLVAVTSDHGEEFLEHGSWEHQKTLYEEVIRVPLFVRAPGVAPRRVAEPTSLLDVAPTLLAWAGVSIPSSMTGRNLLQPVPRRDLYGETDHTIDHTRKMFLRAGARGSKNILSLDAVTEAVHQEEWYDLAADPGETRSVPPRPSLGQNVRAQMIARWRESRRQGAAAPTVALSAEQRERLKALGYVLP